MFGIGMQELLIILVIALVIFGAKKLPDVGSGMGRAIRNFKKAVAEPDQIDITPSSSEKSKESEKNSNGRS